MKRLATLAALALGGCATMTPAAILPEQAVAQSQNEIMRADGHASPEALTRYARNLIGAGDYATALDVIGQAFDPARPDATLLNYQGAALAELGDKAGAALSFERAAALGSAAAAANLDKLRNGQFSGRGLF